MNFPTWHDEDAPLPIDLTHEQRGEQPDPKLRPYVLAAKAQGASDAAALSYATEMVGEIGF